MVCELSKRGRQGVAMGFDDGAVVVKMGREEPAVSMDNGRQADLGQAIPRSYLSVIKSTGEFCSEHIVERVN